MSRKLSRSSIGIAHGRVLDPLNLKPDDVHIEDIAEALSKQCRFTGHLKQFYSVAEHLIRVSKEVPKKDARSAFGHDFSEYILSDFASPLKNALFGERYKEVEDQIMQVISKKFDFDWPPPKTVIYADNALLRTEKRDLMWQIEDKELDDALWNRWFFAEELPDKIVPLPTSDAAKIAFMIQYHLLFDKEVTHS
jgi:uncharacterized protein